MINHIATEQYIKILIGLLIKIGSKMKNTVEQNEKWAFYSMTDR